MEKRSIYIVVMIMAFILFGGCGIRTVNIYSDFQLGMQQFDDLQEKVLSIEGVDNDRSYTTIEMYRKPIEEVGKKLIYKWLVLTVVFACICIIMLILVLKDTYKKELYEFMHKNARDLTTIDYVRMNDGRK